MKCLDLKKKSAQKFTKIHTHINTQTFVCVCVCVAMKRLVLEVSTHLLCYAAVLEQNPQRGELVL